MDKVRLGVIGVGGMGSAHVGGARDIKEIELAGVCDVNADQARAVAAKYNTHPFSDYRELAQKKNVDAILIATPHYYHPPVAVWGFEQGLHVLCEKPIAVTVGEAQKMIDAHRARPELKFGIMFQMRVSPLWRQVKKLIASGELDTIFRMSWIITDWFRTQAYYNSGGWRGTWKGEGGGVLMNQCPHQLDILQWLFGMPAKVTATCRFGRYHRIEVEDDVTAILEYADGRTMTFVTSTGEFPGTNRLEISANRGRVVVEGKKIKFDRTVERVSDFTANSPAAWSVPEFWPAEVPTAGEDLSHQAILKNFIQAILGEEEVIAPGDEGINSLMLANAMVYSGHTGKTVSMPLDGREYDALLKQFVAKSKQ